ncbi:MAG TPA: amidase [Steroidobacteraceae bacterium]|jgi:Asp-tRNA(Asn)/Glu-tRNA(Gln) amidotransferase A subunit family amidase
MKAVAFVVALVAVSCGLASSSVQADPPKSSGFAVEEARIDDIQAAIKSKRITTVQLVHLYLARIKAYNGTCVNQPEGILGPITTIPHAGQINALSTLNLRPATRQSLGFDARKARSMTDAVDSDPAMPDALETAAGQDREFARTGKLVGPLHGVVMAVKDQYDTADMRTTSGADARYANDRPPHDATFVKRLRDAGAIILAKSNLGEYASAVPRSSFGGTFCNPYDTERIPRGSSSGSGSSVAANLVTCAIAEETGSSVRGPASANNEVGLAPTQELVSRYGMMGAGINTRVGPICRTVQDVARILDVISGYDPKDELTAFGIGRKPVQPYAAAAASGGLEGLRIGVVREYMNKRLFSVADAETIDIVDRAVADLRKLGATVVDPGPEGALFTDCIRRYGPQTQGRVFTTQLPELFPMDARGRPVGDHIVKLVDMAADPKSVPERTLRDFGQAAQAEGEGKYMLDRYLRERGDANIKTNADLIEQSAFHQDPHFPDRKLARQNAERAMELDMSDRMLRRFAIQQIVLQCMAEQKLDALVYPTSNLPPSKLGQPEEPPVNARTGVWSMLGQQGFPVMTVPAGFTTVVYDRVRDPTALASPPAPVGGAGGERIAGNDRTRLVGPVPAQLPVGMDIVARPFAEPLLIRIGSAYTAATHHRMAPADFGPVPGER